MKKTTALIVIISMLAILTAGISAEAPGSGQALKPITVFVDGGAVEFDTEPIIKENRTLVPMRAIFEKLGAKVDWNEKEKQVTATKIFEDNSFSIIFIEIGKSEMLIGHNAAGADQIEGTAVELDCPPVIIDSRTLVPLRAISEALGCEVSWNEEERSVKITSDNKNIIESGNYVLKIMEELPENVNYVISPFSLKMAMMMAANGAEGETKKQILTAFGVDNVDNFNKNAKELIERLNASEGGELDIANSLWFNKDYYPDQKVDFSDKFKKTIEEYYGGTAREVTNKNSVEAPNEWVAKKTNGKIKNLIPEDARKYLAAIINAIYMKTKWVSEFDKNNTFEEVFTDIDGKEQKLDFMHQTERFNYFENENTKMICLPYINGLSMYVVLGDAADFDEYKEKMNYCKVRVSLPKFKTEYSVTFNDILKNMGILNAFSDEFSNFDQMFKNAPLRSKIDAVLQKAFIETDEAGTEAAAATAVIMAKATAALGEPEKIYEFKADKPFTYFITDYESGEVLFAGRYVK